MTNLHEVMTDTVFGDVQRTLTGYLGPYWTFVLHSALSTQHDSPHTVVFSLELLQSMRAVDVVRLSKISNCDVDYRYAFKRCLMDGRGDLALMFLTAVDLSDASLHLGFFASRDESRSALEKVVNVHGPQNVYIEAIHTPTFSHSDYISFCTRLGVSPVYKNCFTYITDYEGGKLTLDDLYAQADRECLSTSKEVILKYLLGRKLGDVYAKFPTSAANVRSVSETDVLFAHTYVVPTGAKLPFESLNGCDPFDWEWRAYSSTIEDVKQNRLPALQAEFDANMQKFAHATDFVDVTYDKRWDAASETLSTVSIETANDPGPPESIAVHGDLLVERHDVPPQWEKFSQEVHDLIRDVLGSRFADEDTVSSIFDASRWTFLGPTESSFWLPFNKRLRHQALETAMASAPLHAILTFQHALPHIKLSLGYDCEGLSQWSYDKLRWFVRRMKTHIKKDVWFLYGPPLGSGADFDGANLHANNHHHHAHDNAHMAALSQHHHQHYSEIETPAFASSTVPQPGPCVTGDCRVLDWVRKAVIKRTSLYRSVESANIALFRSVRNKEWLRTALDVLVALGPPPVSASPSDPRSHPLWYYIRLVKQKVTQDLTAKYRGEPPVTTTKRSKQDAHSVVAETAGCERPSMSMIMPACVSVSPTLVKMAGMSLDESPPPTRGPGIYLRPRLQLDGPQKSMMLQHPKQTWLLMQLLARDADVYPSQFAVYNRFGDVSDLLIESDKKLMAELSAANQTIWMGVSPSLIWTGGYLSMLAPWFKAKLAVLHLGPARLMPYYWAELLDIAQNKTRSAGDMSYFTVNRIKINHWTASVLFEMQEVVAREGEGGDRWWSRRWIQKALECLELVGE